MSSPPERPSDCPTRAAIGLGSGFIAGSLFGAISSNWSEIPVVLKDKPWPALVRTGNVMMQYGATIGVVGLAYSTVDCVAEKVRGKKDWVNGSLGGVAAGSVLGLRIGRLPVAVGAGAAMAAMSALIDASGGKLTNQNLSDNATPPRTIYPYKSA